MKDLIRKILKEDNVEKYINTITDTLRKFPTFKRKEEVIQQFAIPKEIEREIRKRSFDELEDLKFKPLDTDDYYDGGFGTYSFKFKIVAAYKTDANPPYGDFSEILIAVEFLDEGYVDVDGEDYTLADGVNDEDWGWEIMVEIDEIIRNVVRKEIPGIIFVDYFSVKKYFYREG